MFFDVASQYVDNIIKSDIIFSIKQLFMKRLFFGLVFLMPLFLMSCKLDSLTDHCDEKVTQTFIEEDEYLSRYYYLGFKCEMGFGPDFVNVDSITFYYYPAGSTIDCGKIK